MLQSQFRQFLAQFRPISQFWGSQFRKNALSFGAQSGKKACVRRGSFLATLNFLVFGEILVEIANTYIIL